MVHDIQVTTVLSADFSFSCNYAFLWLNKSRHAPAVSKLIYILVTAVYSIVSKPDRSHRSVQFFQDERVHPERCGGSGPGYETSTSYSYIATG